MSDANLVIMRHGEASIGANKDFDRSLTNFGQDQVARAAEQLVDKNIQFQMVLASPFIRAQQTAAIVASTMGFPGQIETCEWITPAGTPELFLEKTGVRLIKKTTLLVTHQPFVRMLVEYLTSTSVRMNTATVVGVSIKLYSEGCGEVEWVVQG